MADKTLSKDLIGQVLDGKYQLLSLLGEGGMAVVYKARRLRIDDEVAVKILRPEINLDTVSQARFEREAQAAARIKHPNIVTIHDFGTSTDGLTYLVMEMLEGPTLEDELRKYNGLNIERTLSILLPVCYAIGAAHQEGIVHRDLKPSNILLHSLKDGTELVKVVDFGIVKLARKREALTQVNNLLGTPHYMSPEQCLGRDLDSRSDIYSLGVIGYEMLTGVLPFNEPSIIEILQAHVQYEPHPLRRYRPDLPLPLEAAVLRALMKAPEQRPATALIFAQELMAAVGIAPASNSQQSFKTRTSDMLTPVSLVSKQTPTNQSSSNPNVSGKTMTGSLRLDTISRRVAKPIPDFEQIVGRKRDMDRLVTEYQQSLQNRSRPLVLLGEQGVGLSRLAEEFKRWARRHGALVLLTRFQEPTGMGKLPFQTIIDLIRRIMSIPRKSLTQDSNLSKLVSEKVGIDLPGYIFENRTLNETEKWHAFEAFSSVLVRTLGDHTGVLIFDNLQFAHGLGLEFLSFLLHNYRNRILFLFLARLEEATRKGHPCQEWLAALSRSGSEVIRLQPLTEQDLRIMLDGIFGRLQIAERDIERIWSASHGNPYYIGEIIRLLLNEGKINLKDEQWHCESISDIVLPESLQQLAEHKLARIDESVVELLRQAAVIGQEFSFELLERVSGIDEDELIDGLEQATKAGIIQESQKREEVYLFQDPTLRVVLSEAIPRRRRRKLHLQVAQAMEAEAGNNRQKLLRRSAQLLHHYHEAGQHDKTFQFGRAAAEAALSRMAIADAENYFNWALNAAREMSEEEQTPDPIEMAELQIGAAEIAMLLGNLENAARFIDEAQPLVIGNHSLIGRLQFVKSRIDYSRSEFEQALETAEIGLNAAQASGDAVLESRLLLMLARIFGSLGRTEESIDALECNLDVARQLGDQSTESQILSLMGTTLSLIGNFKQGIVFTEEGLKLARLSKDRLGEMMALRRIGYIYWLLAQPERALECYECGMELARMLESRLIEGLFQNGLGDVYRSLGEMDLARSCYQQYLAIAQSIGHQSGEVLANHNLGLVALELGILPDAVRLLENAVAQHQRLGEIRFLAEAHCGLGQAREQLGQLDKAKDDYQKAIEFCQQIGYPNYEWLARYGLASCYWTYGQADEAIGELEIAGEIIEHLCEAIPETISKEDFMRDKVKVQALLEDIRAN